jgi:hypothetical protein
MGPLLRILILWGNDFYQNIDDDMNSDIKNNKIGIGENCISNAIVDKNRIGMMFISMVENI